MGIFCCSLFNTALSELEDAEIEPRTEYLVSKLKDVGENGWSKPSWRHPDPVHPNAQIYAKMALNILEKVAPSNLSHGKHLRLSAETKEKWLREPLRLWLIPHDTAGECPASQFPQLRAAWVAAEVGMTDHSIRRAAIPLVVEAAATETTAPAPAPGGGRRAATRVFTLPIRGGNPEAATGLVGRQILHTGPG